MGSADRIIRLIVAAIIIVLYFTNVLNGVIGIILLVLAGIFVLTSLIGVCPLYFPLKIDTQKKKAKS